MRIRRRLAVVGRRRLRQVLRVGQKGSVCSVLGQRQMMSGGIGGVACYLSLSSRAIAVQFDVYHRADNRWAGAPIWIRN